MNIADLKVRLTKQMVDNKPSGLDNWNFPRRDQDKALPRVDVDFFGLDTDAIGLSGTAERVVGGIQMLICTDMDQSRAIGDKEANGFADDCKGIFAYGAIYQETGYHIQIVRMPEIRDGYQNPSNKDEWCVPVIVNFEAADAS